MDRAKKCFSSANGTPLPLSMGPFGKNNYDKINVNSFSVFEEVTCFDLLNWKQSFLTTA